MPSSLLGAHPAAASGGETPDETKPDKEGWDKPGEEALSFKDWTTLRSTISRLYRLTPRNPGATVSQSSVAGARDESTATW